MSQVEQNVHPGMNLGYSGDTKHAEVNVFGFWLFLMSDLVTFGIVFAVFGTMTGATAGGPGPEEVTNLHSIALQTALLLGSSFGFSWASLSMKYHDERWRTLGWLAIAATSALGFLVIEFIDFLHWIEIGAVPQRSGYLSALWALVGLHGLHVTAGLLWMGTITAQILRFGLTDKVKSRVTRMGLYWHFLDVVWVGIFSMVFLAGVA
ncbi:Cytochrome bo(3) ubiquinol oxidase subunit 3 [Rhodobacteraceae bacterium THAF1]|uniref:cytochrome c oxidase subunit 3 n=1 Tax=Palleronia sp. THAF1 TaxID=2587842 RepID=UPI000F3B3E7C|nr:cytochrome c oxidase subunit 3 [Palleronia sp. THAF1]QFU08515.1 Cytochrome bo(3) ubiquinol oxidase subunit 3 [Palleronia sp. THAF1]VDC28606.1 Cytochrome bo(3) ubiquinol oxidase subunit 3 [Rhodobacteraceae bacterium THAF1]